VFVCHIPLNSNRESVLLLKLYIEV